MRVHQERILEILIVVLVVMCSGTAGALYIRKYPIHLGQDARSVTKIAPGSQIPPLGDYRWKLHEKTLVLALRVGCPYCEASRTFYETLNRLERSGKIATHLVAVFSDRRNKLMPVLSGGLSNLQALADVDLPALGIGGTPTLLLVGRNGVLERIWRGKLSSTGELDVLSAAGAPLSGSN